MANPITSFPITSFLALTFTGAVWIGAPSPAFARRQARPVSEQPSPMLERINTETQALYDHVRPCLVRVQLPAPRWMEQLGQRDNPANRWQLDPQVKQALESTQGKQAIITPSTQRAMQPDSARTDPAASTQPSNPLQRTVVQRPDGSFELVDPAAAPDDGVIGAVTAPRSLAIIYDDRRHIIVPRFVEKEAIDDEHPPVVFGLAGGAAVARFVGSDRQTNLTVLKLDKPIGRIAPFAGSRPMDGSLVMILAQAGDGGKLIVWTRAQQEQGVVVGVDGNIAGFARFGQFLDARICKPVVDQLIANGKVTRASLGVLVTEGEAPDGRPAMHVDRVKPGSAAQAAGIREGDYIITLAGSPVDDLPTFAAAISAQNGAVPIQLLRGNELVQVQAELRPK